MPVSFSGFAPYFLLAMLAVGILRHFITKMNEEA
jgi:hypothetical protein